MTGAERVLGAVPRPTYAFVGSLHPDLGRVGIILSRAWSARALQGATRCDSGGLHARKAAFGCLTQEEADRALVALSTPGTCAPADWEAHFQEEIVSSYAKGAVGYVAGEEPSLDRLTDGVRARCVQHAVAQGMKLDRRLWTWELRMHDPPQAEEVLAVVLSQEAFKRLEALSNAGELTVNERVSVHYGRAASHWLDNPRIRSALEGAT